MATTQYTSTTDMTAWPATPAYTASGESPILIANPDTRNIIYIWHQLSPTAPSFAPSDGVAIPPLGRYTVTLEDTENVFISALRGKIVNVME